MTVHPRDTILRFWAKVLIGDDGDCWPWQAGCFANGYGAFWVGGKQYRAHRFSFEFFAGRIVARDLNVCHSCDNRICCSPSHLFEGTQLENVADCIAKGRRGGGERAANSKLTLIQVRKILIDPREQREIAADYGVCKSTVGAIKRREIWTGESL